VTLAQKSEQAYECWQAMAVWGILYLIILPFAPRPTVGHAVMVAAVLLLYVIGLVDPWDGEGRPA
jgi:hypothetical protein